MFYQKIAGDIFRILTSEDIDDVIYRCLHWIYIIKRKLQGSLKIWILSSRVKSIFYSFVSLIREILFSPPCNIFYIWDVED